MISAAPAMLDAAAAQAAPAAAPANAAGPAGFDAILLLQSLAATSEALDAAGFEVADTADLLSEDSDEDSEDLESSLAFLSALLNATTPKGSPQDFQGGAQAQGEGADASDAGTALANPLVGSLGSDPEFALVTDGAAKAAELLVAVKPEPLETRATTDASQNLARAAEMLAQASRSAPAAAETPAVATHVRDPRWADDFSARVSLMVRAGESTASLQLTPVDLGPVEVKVTVKDSQATIHFGATQADTRALIEASLPKLRELLASQGFNLMDASVSSGFSRSQQQAGSSGGRANGEAETSTAEARPIRQLGLLDLYA
jgi:flagellar hook-length control protein FliK